MPPNTKQLLTDLRGRPIPQYWNEAADEYEVLVGEAGAARMVLWGPDGQPLSIVNGKLAVRASELEQRLGATSDSAVTDPAAGATVIAALKGILADLGQVSDAAASAGGIGSVSAKLRRVSADLADLVGRIGAPSDDAADAGEQGSLSAKLRRVTAQLATLGAVDDAAVEPGAAGSLSAKLRRLTTDLRTLLDRLGESQEAPAQYTLLARIAQLEAELAAIKGALLDGVRAVDARDLRGPHQERPAPDEVEIGTVYWSVDTGEVAVSTGQQWRKVGDA